MTENEIKRCKECGSEWEGSTICDDCYRAKRRVIMREWRKKNPDKERQYAKESYARNREKELARKKRDYAKSKGDFLEKVNNSTFTTKGDNYDITKKDYNLVEKIKDYHLRRDFGIGLDDLKKMLAEQNYKCKICGKELKIIDGEKNKDAAVVDHDHVTGKIRGVLCHSCNLMLGNAGDNPQLLLNAAEYLGGYMDMAKAAEFMAKYY
jgi:hypothetical protein